MKFFHSKTYSSSQHSSYILGENSTHIERILENSEIESKNLIYLDKVAKFSFVVGMVLIVIIGMHSAIVNLNEKGTSMNQEESLNIHDQFVICSDSLNGVAKLRPQPPKASQTTSNPNATTNLSKTPGINESSSKNESHGSS